MDKVDRDAYSVLCEYYDSIAISNDLMKEFIATSSDEEKVNLYKYVCRRCAELKDKDQAKAVMGYYWMASVELEYTDAIKRYLNGEIKDESLAQAEEVLMAKAEAKAKEDAEVDAIMDLLDQRRRAKTPFGRLRNKFSRKGR